MDLKARFGAKMIQSFTCKDTERFFESGRIPRKAGWQSVLKIAARKLDMLDAATVLAEFKSSP